MPKPSQAPEPSPAILEEALAVARATQKPGQTKEQTRLIAQGIAKGIDHYKRQQNAKMRERDKARKRYEKARELTTQGLPHEGRRFEETGATTAPGPAQQGLVLIVCGSLLLTMALFHAVRLYTGWTVVIDAWTAPPWVSGLAAALFSAAAGWTFLTAYRSR
jgi:hypothetical protein